MSDNMSSSYHLLPEEIVMEILKNVPSKSLIRFKSACKPWCALFSSPRFMAKHLLPDHDQGNNTFLLVKHLDKATNYYVLSTLSNDTLEVIDQPPKSLPPYPHIPDDKLSRYPYAGPEAQILGSGNGLVCISYRMEPPYTVLWRPATGYVKILPPREPPPGAPYFYEPLVAPPDVGFGYDADSQDYKVIRVHRHYADHHRDDNSALCYAGYTFEVYSFNSDSWRRVGRNWGPDLDLVVGQTANFGFRAYAKGVFSWIGSTWDETITWFRLSDEALGSTMLPPKPSGHEWSVSNLMVLNEDRVAVVMFAYLPQMEEGCYHVWVLLEYEVEDSWTRLFVVGPMSYMEKIAWFWKEDKMILVNIEGDLALYVYDPFTQEKTPLNVVDGGLAAPLGYFSVEIVSYLFM